MNSFITTGNPPHIKYWINIQQLCWCFLRFGSTLSLVCHTLTEWPKTHFRKKSPNGGLPSAVPDLHPAARREGDNATRS